MAYKIGNCVVIDDSRNICNIPTLTSQNVVGCTEVGIPVGTTAARPGSPVTGSIRYNTTTSSTELYNGSSWTSVGGGTGTRSSFFMTVPFWDYQDPGDGAILYRTDNIYQPAAPNYGFSSTFVALRAGSCQARNAGVYYTSLVEHNTRKMYGTAPAQLMVGDQFCCMYNLSTCQPPKSSISAVSYYGEYDITAPNSSGRSGAMPIAAKSCAYGVVNYINGHEVFIGRCFTNTCVGSSGCCIEYPNAFLHSGHIAFTTSCDNLQSEFLGAVCCGISVSIEAFGCCQNSNCHRMTTVTGWCPAYLYNDSCCSISQAMCYQVKSIGLSTYTCATDRPRGVAIDFPCRCISVAWTCGGRIRIQRAAIGYCETCPKLSTVTFNCVYCSNCTGRGVEVSSLKTFNGCTVAHGCGQSYLIVGNTICCFVLCTAFGQIQRTPSFYGYTDSCGCYHSFYLAGLGCSCQPEDLTNLELVHSASNFQCVICAYCHKLCFMCCNNTTVCSQICAYWDRDIPQRRGWHYESTTCMLYGTNIVALPAISNGCARGSFAIPGIRTTIGCLITTAGLGNGNYCCSGACYVISNKFNCYVEAGSNSSTNFKLCFEEAENMGGAAGTPWENGRCGTISVGALTCCTGFTLTRCPGSRRTLNSFIPMFLCSDGT